MPGHGGKAVGLHERIVDVPTLFGILSRFGKNFFLRTGNKYIVIPYKDCSITI